MPACTLTHKLENTKMKTADIMSSHSYRRIILSQQIEIIHQFDSLHGLVRRSIDAAFIDLDAFLFYPSNMTICKLLSKMSIQ